MSSTGAPAGAKRIALLVVGPDVVGGSQRVEVDIYKHSTLEYLAHELEGMIQFFSANCLINLIEYFDYKAGEYRPLQYISDLEDRARLRVRCAHSASSVARNRSNNNQQQQQENYDYRSSAPTATEAAANNSYNHKSASQNNHLPFKVDREMDSKAEQIRRQASSPEARRKFTQRTPEYGGAPGRAAMIGKHLSASSAVSSTGSNVSAASSATLELGRRVGSRMNYLNGPFENTSGGYGDECLPNGKPYNYNSSRGESVGSGRSYVSSHHNANNTNVPSAAASHQYRQQVDINRQQQFQQARSPPAVLPEYASENRPAAYYGVGADGIPYHYQQNNDNNLSPRSPPPPVSQHVPGYQPKLTTETSDHREMVTIFCVYNGVDVQRAKALTVSRKRPDYNVVLNSLETKFQNPLCLGYIDPDTGNCEEVHTQQQFASIINEKSHRHDPNAGVTFQCWMRIDPNDLDQRQVNAEGVVVGGTGYTSVSRQRQQRQQEQAEQEQEQQEQEEKNLPQDSEFVHVSPSLRREQIDREHQQHSVYTVTSHSNVPNSTRGIQQQQQTTSSTTTPRQTPRVIAYPTGGGHLNTTAPELQQQQQQQPYQYGGTSPPPAQSASSAKRNNNNTTRVSQYALQKLQQLEEEQARQRRAASPTDSNNNNRVPSSGRPIRQNPNQKRKSAATRSVAASVISLQSASVLVTDDQLREVFDELDPEGCGYVTKAACRTYFDRNVDTMGVPKAGNKFEKMLASSRRAHDLDFDEFCVVMLKVAQW